VGGDEGRIQGPGQLDFSDQLIKGRKLRLCWNNAKAKKLLQSVVIVTVILPQLTRIGLEDGKRLANCISTRVLALDYAAMSLKSLNLITLKA
jgi:hypothetical protein